MGKLFMKISILVMLAVAAFSCSEKRGFEKVKEGVTEMSDDAEEESKAKNLEIKFGK